MNIVIIVVISNCTIGNVMKPDILIWKIINFVFIINCGEHNITNCLFIFNDLYKHIKIRVSKIWYLALGGPVLYPKSKTKENMSKTYISIHKRYCLMILQGPRNCLKLRNTVSLNQFHFFPSLCPLWLMYCCIGSVQNDPPVTAQFDRSVTP